MTSSNENIFRVTGHLCGGIQVNNRGAGDLRLYRAQYDVTVMDHIHGRHVGLRTASMNW